jgi:outer membrane protein with beta-barrel domain
MIKKVALIILLTFAYQTGQSQVLISLLLGDKLNTGKIEFGLDMGVNFSRLTNFESGRTLNKFNIGFYFDFLLKNHWYLNTGVLVKSNVGLNYLRENDVLILDPATVFNPTGIYSQTISYFHVPVAIKYHFKSHFYASVGPQFALRTKAYLIYDEEINLRSVQEKFDNRDLFTRLEVGAIGAFGYKFKKGEGISIGFKYFHGFTNIFKDDYYNSKNSSGYIYTYIPIGKAKVEKKPKK